MQPNHKITSVVNPKIKKVIELRNHRERKKENLAVVEGVAEILCALEAGVHFKEFFITEAFLNGPVRNEVFSKRERLFTILNKLSSNPKIIFYETAENVMAKISYGERNEGIVGVCLPRQYSFDDLNGAKNPLFVVVEKIEKPGNLGAILRTADAAGVNGVLICDAKTDLYNPNVIRASIGTIFSLKTVVASNDEVFNFFKKNKIKICAATPQAKNIYTGVDLKGALAIVVGSEDLGLSDDWLKRADITVKIPMNGVADSLNVSTSTAILVYEALRQRKERF